MALFVGTGSEGKRCCHEGDNCCDLGDVHDMFRLLFWLVARIKT